jgi:anti-anti-sigma factor
MNEGSFPYGDTMEITNTIRERHIIVEVHEEVGLYNSLEFKNHLNDLIENTNLGIVINLTGIHYADSAMIASLLFAAKKAKVLGREFGLVYVEEEILNIIRLANIDKHFKYYENIDEVI